MPNTSWRYAESSQFGPKNELIMISPLRRNSPLIISAYTNKRTSKLSLKK